MTQPYDLVVLGLSLSSSWGNGHATTYRALLAGLEKLGHRVLFLERDVPWYAEHRDLPDPPFCDFALYEDLDDLGFRFGRAIRDARVVMVGSYVPDGIRALDIVLTIADGAVVFYDIDTPVTLAGLEAGREDYIARRQIPRLDAYYSFTGGPTLDRLRTEYGAHRAEALYCSVEEARYRPTGEPIAWDLGYLGTYSADRQPGLERLLLEPARLLPHLRFVVAGPQYPADIRWPSNVERIDHLPPAEHASFYSRQRFTLNLTRADMARAGWSPSVRLFEAAACGVPIISDVWDGLDEILPVGRAVLTVETGHQVAAILTSTPDPRRELLGGTGRAAVLRHHTGLARAVRFAESLAGLGEGGRAEHERHLRHDHANVA